MAAPTSSSEPVVLIARDVLTMADGSHDGAAAGAVALRDGRVVAAGSTDDVRAALGTPAQEIDLGDATIIPGIVDTHPHLLHFAALGAHLVDLADAVDHDDVVTRIAARAAVTPAGEWISCTPVGEAHYFIRRSARDLREGVLPDRAVLDRATATHPVFIQAWAPRTPNVCACNTSALERLGLFSPGADDDLPGVEIVRDAAGHPTGLLRGAVNNYYNASSGMFRLFRRMPPLIVPEIAFGAVLEAMRAFNSMGVTTVYEGHAMGANEIGLYTIYREQGLLTMRVKISPEAEIAGMQWSVPLDESAFDASLASAAAAVSNDDDMLRQDGVTIQLGGPCWPGMMLTHEPYPGPDGALTTGVEVLSLDKARRIVAFCRDRGLRLNMVAVSPREYDDWLAIIDDAGGPGAPGWIVQHAFFVRDEDAKRFADHQFDVTTSMSFSWGKGDLFVERLGEDVLTDLIPLRRLLDHGVGVGCGTDWGPKNVFEHLALAMTHQFAGSGRTNLGPAQEITRSEALRMWTSGAADVIRWPGAGRLTAGSYGDLAVLDRNPLSCDLDDLADTRVLATVLGGTVVHGSL